MKVLGAILGFCRGAGSGINFDDYCCVPIDLFGGVGFGGAPSYTCISHNNQPINKCEEIKDNATLSLRDYCGAGGLWEYDPGTKKCKRVAESLWGLTFDCAGGKGIGTAIGCVPTDNLLNFLKFVLKFALYASGGIIVLMIMATGYTIITSSGNPEKLQAAKENVVALFSGLALIAFSLILLYTIGGGILGLPTF